MSKQTNEHAFETQVEETLLGVSGWQSGTNAEWNVERALFPAQVCTFLDTTQPKLWAEMRALHGDGLEKLLIAALVKELDVKGTLHVLRHGFKFYGKIFRIGTFKPAHGLNDEVLSLYRQNRITITRQVLCHPGKHDTVDLLFALNGLPVATCELENPRTGQSWRHAVRQYQKDRDPRAPLFRFKTRALVHFAADPDEIHMATRLSGDRTHFLPFNRGSHPGEIQCGAGNPQHSSGYRTGYFWDDVLQRDSFLDILGHFLFVETGEEKVDDGKGSQRQITRETVIFPRYHQLDAVRKIVAAARGEKPEVAVTTAHPLVTLVTMVAPRLDWFVGVSGLSLLDAQGEWLLQHQVDLFPYDAGTEEGTKLSLSNPATSPQGMIASLKGTGKFSDQPIARLTFDLQLPVLAALRFFGKEKKHELHRE